MTNKEKLLKLREKKAKEVRPEMVRVQMTPEQIEYFKEEDRKYEAAKDLKPLDVKCDHRGKDYHCPECCPGQCEMHNNPGQVTYGVWLMSDKTKTPNAMDHWFGEGDIAWHGAYRNALNKVSNIGIHIPGGTYEVRRYPDAEPKPKKEKPSRQGHPYKKHHPEVSKGRLPHMTGFHAEYDAEKVEWTGSLVIPISADQAVNYKATEDSTLVNRLEGGHAVGFKTKKKALFHCAGRVDEKYRAWLAAQSKKEVPNGD